MNAPNLYHYHPATLEFVGVSIADESPLEPGVHVVPAHSTLIAPPDAPSGHVAIWDVVEESWSVIEDHRGEVWWVIETGGRVTISFLGDPSEHGYTHIEPPPQIPTEYTLPADLPWNRMTEEEAELVQDEIDTAPVKTRNMINKATSFTTGGDAFIKFKAIIGSATSVARADEIMAYPLSSELASALLMET